MGKLAGFFYLPFIEKPKFPITNTTRTNATERIIAGKSRDLICGRQMRQYKDRLFHEQEYSSDICRTILPSTFSLSLQKDHILNCEGKLIQENVGANLNQSITHFKITIIIY